MIRLRRAAAFLLLLSCSGDPHPVDFPDQDLPPPGSQDLEARLRHFRDGSEKHHGDPKLVAHLALLDHLDVPWRGEPFEPRNYQFFERNSKHPEWGTYVVRAWTERSGSPRQRRYRVKVRPYEEIWYPIQVSRYIVVDLPDEDPREGPPDVRK